MSSLKVLKDRQLPIRPLQARLKMSVGRSERRLTPAERCSSAMRCFLNAIPCACQWYACTICILLLIILFMFITIKYYQWKLTDGGRIADTLLTQVVG